MNHRINTFLFDLDGCLAHTLPTWLKSFQQTFRQFDISVTDKELLDIGFHRIYEQEYGIEDKELFINTVYSHYQKNFGNSPLHTGALNILKILKRKKNLIALVTSSRRVVVEAFISKHHLADYFNYTLAWEDTNKNKPDPEPILKAIDMLKSNPNNTMMIGDSDADILAAKAAKVTSVWFHPKLNEQFYKSGQFDHHKPDYTIRHFREILEIV